MDLHEFPFDEDALEFTLCGTLLRDGRTADASDFVLVPCNASKGRLGWPFMTLSATTDSMPDYELLGTTVRAYQKTRKNTSRRDGYSRTSSYIHFAVHVRRFAGFFFWYAKLATSSAPRAPPDLSRTKR